MLIKQPGVTGQPHERREELQVVVELDVVDDRSHVQVLPRLGLGSVFGPQPAQGRRHQRIVVGLKALDVTADDCREVEAADQVLERLQLICDLPEHIGVGSAGRANLVIELGDPPFDDAGECPAFGLGPGREVAHQFRVEVARLAGGTVQTALQGDVGLGDDELPFECDCAGQVEEEALARAVPADDESNARAALFDSLEIVRELRRPRRDARPEGGAARREERRRPVTIEGSHRVPAA